MREEEEQENDTGEMTEASHNLLGVFAILLAVDRRINPYSYIPPKED